MDTALYWRKANAMNTDHSLMQSLLLSPQTEKYSGECDRIIRRSLCDVNHTVLLILVRSIFLSPPVKLYWVMTLALYLSWTIWFLTWKCCVVSDPSFINFTDSAYWTMAFGNWARVVSLSGAARCDKRLRGHRVLVRKLSFAAWMCHNSSDSWRHTVGEVLTVVGSFSPCCTEPLRQDFAWKWPILTIHGAIQTKDRFWSRNVIH